MRKILTLLLLVAGFAASSQEYNNEWIKHTQTYYKIRIAKDGLYRIPKSLLDANGLGGAQVQFLELWRNGEKVPFYPTVSSGVLPSNGYIEFWGKRNDGKPDRALYRDPAYQHTQAYSLQSDTATYFLSVSSSTSAGIRYTDVNNNVAGNTLPAEQYFMYTNGYYYGSYAPAKPNLGLAWNVGSDVYSSSYDKGEFFGSGNLVPGSNFITQVPNLGIYPPGPPATLRFGAVGNAANTRHIVVQANGGLVKDTVMNYYDDLISSGPVDNNSLSTDMLNVQFNNTSNNPTDRLQISFFELTYPRTFNLNGLSNFEFELPARSTGYFLRIWNGNMGSATPVLYDIKNRERYTANMNSGVMEFALTGSANSRQLVLVSEDGANVNTITKMTTRNFINYSDQANQGTYIIISNPLLYVGSSGNNPVQDYKNYRASTAGGGFNVMIADIGDLVDQFAFGINKHPLSVRNFIRFARAKFAKEPQNIFLIGKAISYWDYQYGDRLPSAAPLNDVLNLVPTFGTPGSDNLLSAEDLTMPVAATPIGRLSAVNGKEVEDYLAKVKEYEQVQKNAPNTIAARGWMKNVVHITGSSDAYLGTVLCNYMDIYRHIIEDTLYGGKVQMFCKGSNFPGNQVSPEKLAKYFADGLSIINYFGHSSSTTLEFNIDDPYNYNNPGKYPVFFVNGCKAGDFFSGYIPARVGLPETLSEKFVLAKQRGGIAFIASTHFGIVNYLNMYLSYLYQQLSSTDYDKSLGLTMRDALKQMVVGAGSYDFYARMHAEQMTLNGDPAIVINGQLKPDYVVEDQTVEIDPAFVSVAEGQFTVRVKTMNLGKAVSDSVVLEVKQQYPNGTIATLYRQKIAGVRYADSIELSVPIISARDKGLNKIIATIDADGKVNEVSESNNTITKEFYIFENEARPVYPYMYAITNNPTQTLYAATANALAELRNYVVEVDTTGLFNSSLKVSKQVSAPGGVFEINPGMTYQDSTVYYWRIAAVPDPGGQYQWVVSSFMYINGNIDGYAQAHHFQNLNSSTERMSLDSASRQWKFGTRVSNLKASVGTWGNGAVDEGQMEISVNGTSVANNFCAFNSITFNVFDPVTFALWKNKMDPVTGLGLYGSESNNCSSGRDGNFEFRYTDTASRNKMRIFMENVIPDGHYVVARTGYRGANVWAADWANDTTYYGKYTSMYHSLLKFGLTTIDSFYRPRQFIFIFKKNDNGVFSPVFKFSDSARSVISLSADCITPDTLGYITSPVFGPAKSWKDVMWSGVSLENPSADNPMVQVIGIKDDFTEDVLYTLDKDTRTLDISSVVAAQYPTMKLRMRNIDSTKLTPFQLKSWKITYVPVPEGSLAANMFLVNMKDTLALGETAKFGIAFKNISKTPFVDSLKIKAVVTDDANVAHTLFVRKQKPLVVGDTLIVQLELNATDYPGNNMLFVDVNTDNDQKEEYHFNNFVYKNFFVVTDSKNPLLDVTFDGVHILNKDIVSAKPHIQIKLTDESKYLLLNDTTLSSVQVQYPDGTLRTYNFDGDTLRFIPATSGSNNTATIEFTPQFTKQINPEGDLYELIVKGKDRSGNKAGEIAYRIGFTVISKPMISNVLNYPNPFSTSTAFVFTITGSEVPQNVRVQILTVTGKIVREITMNELGPLHIGRNITEYKWNGTDQYGDKLANGVYLYRVITSMNGKTMEKYKSKDDNTDKYFNNGYGKMYLMR